MPTNWADFLPPPPEHPPPVPIPNHQGGLCYVPSSPSMQKRIMSQRPSETGISNHQK